MLAEHSHFCQRNEAQSKLRSTSENKTTKAFTTLNLPNKHLGNPRGKLN